MRQFYIFAFLTIAVLSAITNTAQAQDPFVPKYDAVKRSERCFTVTNDINNQFGSVWWSDKVDFSRDTLFNFVVYMGDKDGPGADGLAFVMHQDPRDTITDPSQTVIISGSNIFDLEAATGDDGGGLGFAYKLGNFNNNTIPGAFPEPNIENHKIQPSVAIEIDTWRNNEVHDGAAGLDANGVNQPLSPYIGWDHTSVIYNGDLYGGQQQISDSLGYTDRILPLKPSYAFGTGNNDDGSVYHNIEDDGCYTFQVKWTVNGDGTQTLQLYADVYDGTSDASNLFQIMNHTDDMLNGVFGGNPIMRFGFTGSTGGSRNEQTICLLGENLKPFAQDDYASVPMNTTVDIRIEDNDNDPDGDQLHVPVIIGLPENGQATIIYNASTDQNELQYEPDNNYTGPDSLTYVTCDVNSTKCYAKCDTAMVRINVGCTAFDATVAKISPNNVCSDTAVANGAATADVDGSSLFGILWYESFEDLSNGTTVDNGTSAWSFTTSGGCDKDMEAEVTTHSGPQKFMVQETKCEVIWSTEVIDISAVTDVAVSIDLQENGGLENEDYIGVYYIVDGGAEVLLNNGYHQNDFSGTEVAMANSINGSTLQIVVRAKNSSGSERYYWDNISITAVGAGVPDVTYNWYEGTTPTGPVVHTGITFSGMEHGDYTVVAVDNNSGCPSTPATVTIDSTGTNVQGGYVQQLAPYTNCALPYNGALGAGVYNGTDSTTTGYVFEWYFQEDPKIPAFLKNTGAIYSGLESREFSVVITDNTTGCDTTINREVLNAAVLPSVTASTDADVVSCLDPETGTVSAFVMAPVIVPIWDEDFSDQPTGTIEDTGTTAWTWETPDDSSKVEYVGIETGNDDPETDNHLEFHETRGNRVNWWTEVIDISGYTDVSVSFDLYASIKMNEKLAEPPEADKPRFIHIYYSIDGGPQILFPNGSHDEVPIPAPITLSLSGINANSIQIFIEMSNGMGGERYFIDDILVQGGLPPAPTTTGYTFYWYDGPAVTASSDYTGPLYDGVAAGQYTVVAVNDVTSCASESRTVTVADSTEIPNLLITVDSDQWSCDPANPTGELTGAVDEGGTPTTTGYTFNWYRGPNDVVPARPGYTGGPNVDGLEADTYRLVVAADTTGCSNFADTVVQDVTVIPPDITLTPTHVTSCVTGNGVIAVGVVGDPNDYTYELYTGFGVVPANLAATSNSPSFTNLNFGDYTVIAINSVTSCATNPATVTLNDATVLPTATFTKAAQVSCDPASLTGMLTAVPGSGLVSDYIYDWTDGLGNPIVGPGDGETISSLDAGNYTLRITNIATQCFTDYNPTVDNGIELPVATASSDSSTYCGTAVNGQLHGLGDGIAAGFTFNWYNTDYSVQLADASDLAGIAPGDYHLAVMNDTTSCVSDTVNITVDARPILPQANIVSQDQYSCDPANLMGGLTANVIADPITGSSTAADFTFDWEDALGNPIAGSGVNGEVLTGLDVGNYQLALTDNTSECTNTYLPSVASGIVLPVATASADSSTYCGTSVNGQLHGLGDGIAAGFTFNWYNTDYSVQLADASDLTGIAPGDYHLAVMNDTTWCVSDTVNVTVDARPVLPQANIVSQDQYSCDPANLTGGLTANVVADPITGSSTPADFTFDWEDGLGNPIAGTGINGEVLSALDAGNYQLVLTDNISECANTYLPSVASGIVLPVATGSADSSTYCGIAANGQLHGLGDGITAGFTFNWYNTDYSVQLADASDLTGIAPGDYHLAVMNDTTWCLSDTVHLTVDARPVIPQANIVSQDQLSCDPGNLMGRLTASAVPDPITGSSTPADFTFDWTDGLGNPIAGTGVNGEVLTGLDVGNYQLVLTDNTSECTNTYLPSVANGVVLPVVTATTTAATMCAANVNGQIDASVTGVLSPFTGYTFDWERVSDGFTWSGASFNASSLAPGDYLVTATLDSTACVSNQITTSVADNSITPNPVFSLTDNSSCDPANPNGEVVVNNVSNEADAFPAGYDFLWYDGNSSGPQLVAPTVSFPNNPDSSRIANKDAGTVALVITNSTTLCSNEVPMTVNNINVFPIIDALNVTDAPNCAEPYFSAAVIPSVTDPVSALHTYNWYQIDGTPIPGVTTNVVEDSVVDAYALPPGDYKVVVVNEWSCPSDTSFFEIQDISTPPTFTLTTFNNTSCDPNDSTGILVATEDAPFTISQYEWFYNAPLPGNEVLPAIPAGDSIHYNLAGAFYAVRVTDAVSNCTSVEFATILDLPANKPLLDTTYIVDITSCVSPNGEFGLQVAPLQQIPPALTQNRTYTFYAENNTTLADTTAVGVRKLTTNPAIAAADTVAFLSVTSGDWTSLVVDNYTHCVSDPLTINMPEAPGVVLTVLDSLLPTDCHPDSTGWFQYGASSPFNTAPAGDGFSFTWDYWGTQFAGPVENNIGTVDPTGTDSFMEKRDGLKSGYYTLFVLDSFSMCTAVDTIYIPVKDAPPSVLSDAINATDCVPGDGLIEFEVVNQPTSGMIGDYDVILFRGSTTDPAREMQRVNVAAYNTPYTFGPAGADFLEDLPPGNYTLVTQENSGLSNGCFSEPLSVTLTLDITPPTITASITDDYSCNATGNGEITVTATDNAEGDLNNLFDYEWYAGTDTVGAVISAVDLLSNRLAGNYTVKVVDADRQGFGCRYRRTFDLPKVLKTITLTTSSTDNTNCVPDQNGTAQITDVDEDGAGGGFMAAYTDFTLSDSGFNPLSTIAAGPANFTNLAPGNYYLSAENITTGCVSQVRSISIADNSVDPNINLVVNNLDFGCTAAAADGDLEVDINGSQNVAEYSFTWYQGAIAPGNDFDYDANATGLTANSSSQLYSIEVVDIDGTDGNLSCRSTLAYTLVHQPTQIYFLAADLVSTDQTICGPNGSILVDTIRMNDGSGEIASAPSFAGVFDARLLDNSLNLIDPIANPYASFDPATGWFGAANIPAGTYYVEAAISATGCSYGGTSQVIIDSLARRPVVTMIEEMPDYACAGGIPTGRLAPTVAGGSDGTFNYGDFTYTWSANVASTDNGGGTYADKATALSPDTYTLTVTDIAGADATCETTINFTLSQKRHVLAITASATDQTICGPNGTIQLDAINEDGSIMALNAAEWTVSLLDNTQADITPAGPTGFAGDPYTSLAAANYFIRVQDDSTLCYSDPLPVVVTDVSKDPIVTILQEMPDYACAGGIPTGILAPTVAGGTDGTFNYGDFIYSWSANVATTDNGGGAYVDKATSLSPDRYILTVTDNAGVDANCVTTVNFTLNQARHDLTIAASQTDQTICGPNGTIQLDAIDKDGTNMALNAAEWTVFLLDNTQADITPAGPTGFAGDPYTSLAAADYFIRVQDDSTLCYSDPLPVVITDVSNDPLVTILQEMPDFACAGGIPTGILAPTVTGGTDGTFNYGDFIYSWSANVATTDNGGGAYVDKATSLSPDMYTLTVTDNAGVDANCVTTVNFTLNQARHDLTITASQTDQTICGPNGTIQLDAIDEDGNNMALNAAEWTVFLLDNTQADITPAGPTGFAGDPYTSLAATDYFIRVQDDSTLCYSDPLPVVVTDLSKDPVVTIVQEMPDYACAGGIPTGRLAPAVAGGSDGTFNYGDFIYSWSANVATTDNGGGAYVDKATGLSPDLYTLTVTDNAGVDAGCVTTVDFTLNQSRHILEITASGTDQTICTPNGTIQLDAIVEDGNNMALNAAEWTVFLLTSTQADITPVGPTGFAGDPYTGIAAADYFVRVQDDSTLCYSDVYPVKIIDVSESPVLDIAVRTPQYSLNPNPASWTGVLEVSAAELATGTPDPLGYSYSWHSGLDNTTPVISTLDSATQLDIGDYTVYARSLTSNCESSFSAYLPYQYLEPTFNTLMTPKTVCAPDNGAIDVTDIALEGDPDLLSDYTFNWHHDVYDAMAAPDNVIPGDDTRTAYLNLNSGTYYVVARENWWMVESLPVQVNVADSSTNPIIIFDGTNYQAVTSCDEVAVANGALAVEVYEDLSNPYLLPPPYNYTYRWFNGDNVAPANQIAGQTSNAIVGLRSGSYSVEVTNMANNCVSEETYFIEDQSVIPTVTTTQTPNINCEVSIANGIASATVINSGAAYEFHWYEGTDTSGAPDHIGMAWDDRPAGEYSVIAIDQEFGNCISEPMTMLVTDKFTYPVILVNELSPVTNCDPARPNGVLTAVTENGIEGYTFEWYLNDSLYSTGPTPNNLGAYSYELIARNDVTQCHTSMQAGPTTLLRAVPAPDVDILDEQTSCIDPNAIVTASVNGSVTNHILRYYNKYTQEELTNYYEHYTLYNLDTSTYYVTAEDRTTGCISDSTEFVISDETYFPEFEVVANPSNCEDPTGSADVLISDMSRDFKVTWYNDEGFMQQQKEIVYIPMGTYYVDVEGTDGCVTSSQVEIKGDVVVYNGVSPNDDGMNDYFKIVCLHFFPDNNVKIFNRAGVLVFEQSNYDHFTERRFEGISNRGLNLIGQELPIGTYFYVIDKNDGSKATVGYLELKR